MRCLLFLSLLSTLQIHAARFTVSGPVVTVTLKEPSAVVEKKDDSQRVPWLDCSQLTPSIVTTVQSEDGPPLPNWLPNLSRVRATAAYEWKSQADVNVRPTWLQAAAEFRLRNSKQTGFLDDAGSDDDMLLTVQPTHVVATQATDCKIRLQVRAHDVVAQFARNTLQSVSGTLRLALPFAQVSAVSISPRYYHNNSNNRRNTGTDGTSTTAANEFPIACTCEAISGRTKAVLELTGDDPTLQLVHQIDSRHTIAPLVHILTAKLSYQWQCLLNGGARVITTVDPTSHVHIRWTDPAVADGGHWVTECHLPLQGTTLAALAADIRVRRQFRF